MAYRVELTTRADRDLRRIYRHVHADDAESAFAWFNGLEALVYSLDKLPNRGAITPESKELRHLLYGNRLHVYRIIYRVHEGAKKVRVLHVRHGAREVFKRGELEQPKK
jgi:plasmid stabilization system protein ParE